MVDKKIVVLASELLKQCETQGLTISEIRELPTALKIQIEENIHMMNGRTEFKRLIDFGKRI